MFRLASCRDPNNSILKTVACDFHQQAQVAVWDFRRESSVDVVCKRKGLHCGCSQLTIET